MRAPQQIRNKQPFKLQSVDGILSKPRVGDPSPRQIDADLREILLQPQSGLPRHLKVRKNEIRGARSGSGVTRVQPSASAAGGRGGHYLDDVAEVGCWTRFFFVLFFSIFFRFAPQPFWRAYFRDCVYPLESLFQRLMSSPHITFAHHFTHL